MGSTRTVAAAVLICASCAGGDIIPTSQVRRVEVWAYRGLTGSPTEDLHESDLQLGLGPWTAGASVATPVPYLASASASIESAIAPTGLSVSGATAARATRIDLHSQTRAHAVAEYRVGFNVDVLTPVRFRAVVPAAALSYSSTYPTLRIRLMRASQQVLAQVTVTYSVSQGAIIDPPVDLRTTLAPGAYIFEAFFDHQGVGFPQPEPLGSYIASLSFEASLTPECYANCDGGSTLPVLNVADFVCFQNRFSAGDTAANCDGSSTAPVLNIYDFICFMTRFSAGCP